MRKVLKKSCDDITTIKEINDQYDYTDTHRGGIGDSEKVSCGQNGIYNELRDKFSRYYHYHAEKNIAKAMCRCCKAYSGHSWSSFYDCLKRRGFDKKSDFM